MMQLGIHRQPSTNGRTFCFDIKTPDHITIWYEEPRDKPQDHWWDQELTPNKCRWLVRIYNNGKIHEEYGYYMEARRHIDSLLELSYRDLLNVFNYHAYLFPHEYWVGDEIPKFLLWTA